MRRWQNAFTRAAVLPLNPASQTDIGYSPKIKLPYAAYAKNGTAAVVTTDPMAEIGVRARWPWSVSPLIPSSADGLHWQPAAGTPSCCLTSFIAVRKPLLQ